MSRSRSSVHGAGFWLPSEFLTDDDFLMGGESFSKRRSAGSGSEFRFLAEVPRGFESERDQRFEKLWMMSSSPQSTLANLGRSAGGSSNGSPNGVASPDGASYDAVGDLIYRAADQVAKLKLHGADGLELGAARYQGLFAPPNGRTQFYSEGKSPNPSCFSNAHFQQKQRNEGSGLWYNQQKQLYQNRGRAVNDTAQAAWSFQQAQGRGRAASLGGYGGSGGGGGVMPAKRASVGTGVFLPRRYENNNDSNGYSSDSRKKPGSTSVLPGRAAIHAPSKNLNDMNGFAQSQQQSQTQTSRGFVPDYTLYSLIGRRHTMLLQQRRSFLSSMEEGSSIMSRDTFLLPQEWSY